MKNNVIKVFSIVCAAAILVMIATSAHAQLSNGDDDQVSTDANANVQTTGNTSSISNSSDDSVNPSANVGTSAESTSQVFNGDDDTVVTSSTQNTGTSSSTVSNGGDDVVTPPSNTGTITVSTSTVSNGDDDVVNSSGNQGTSTGGSSSVTNGDDDTDGSATGNGGNSGSNGGSSTTATPSISVGGGSSTSSGGSILLSNVAATSTGTTTCPLITSYMKMGWDNDPAQVTKLQAFLKSQGIDVQVTGTFDVQTKTAVEAFQTMYKGDILAPWGAAPTGTVYITTLKEINELACKIPLTLNADELKVITDYKNSLNQTNTSTTTVGVAGPHVIDAVASTTSTSTAQLVGQTMDQGADTAAVGNASVIQRLWSFLTNLF